MLGTLKFFLDNSRKWLTNGINDTGGKFAIGFNDKFAARVYETDGKLPAVSTTPVVNLPTVSMSLVANNGNNIRLLTS
jgi:hypothetical protein